MKSLPYHLFALLSLAQVTQGAITIGSSSNDWTPFTGNYDYSADQQTGQASADIVGAGTNYGFLMSFDDNGDTSSTDGDLAFRIRFNDAGDKQNPPNFKNVVWVGIDADLNGSIDVFLGLDAPSNGGTPTLSIRDSGTAANTSPSTTSISSSSFWSTAATSTNYNYRAVDFNSDGGTTNDAGGDTNPDFYVSFMVPFQQVVNFLNTQSISITDHSPLRYIVATSQQTNSLNQDLGGVNGEIGSTTTWEALGGFSNTVALVPEPSSGLLAFGSLAGFLFLTRRR